MTKTTEKWEESWDKMIEENEFYGMEFDYAEPLIKRFISFTAKNAREDLTKEILSRLQRMKNSSEMREFEGERYTKGFDDAINEVIKNLK